MPRLVCQTRVETLATESIVIEAAGCHWLRQCNVDSTSIEHAYRQSMNKREPPVVVVEAVRVRTGLHLTISNQRRSRDC
jgi:hypothetical protein